MDTTHNTILKCTDISKRFGYFVALKKVSFDVKSRSIFGILGANGAGKTTLIRIIAGLLTPTKGEISIADMNYSENSSQIKKMLGLFTDQSFLYEDLTIFENLKFYANLFGHFNSTEIKASIDRFTKLFNMNDWVDEPIKNLSAGMKRKVELIRILIHKPELILFDEPFSGLDFTSINKLLELITTQRDEGEVSFIITTHNISLASKICDRLLVLKRGKISKILGKDEFDEDNIRSYF